MNTKYLVKKIQYFDNCYRKGEAKISDVEFDQLVKQLKARNPNHPAINPEGMKLLSLGNSCFSEWWEEKARNETVIVQAKIDGCALGLRYVSGTLIAVFTRSCEDVSEAARTIANIPTDGLVVKIALGATKQRLGINSVAPNWAFAMK